MFAIIEAANTLPLINGQKIQWEPLLNNRDTYLRGRFHTKVQQAKEKVEGIKRKQEINYLFVKYSNKAHLPRPDKKGNPLINPLRMADLIESPEKVI